MWKFYYLPSWLKSCSRKAYKMTMNPENTFMILS